MLLEQETSGQMCYVTEFRLSRTVTRVEVGLIKLKNLELPGEETITTNRLKTKMQLCAREEVAQMHQLGSQTGLLF
jgi:hypothetical protein